MAQTEKRWVKTGRRGEGRPALVNIHPEHLDYPGSLPHVVGERLTRWPEQRPTEIDTEAPGVENKAVTVDKPARKPSKAALAKAAAAAAAPAELGPVTSVTVNPPADVAPVVETEPAEADEDDDDEGSDGGDGE